MTRMPARLQVCDCCFCDLDSQWKALSRCVTSAKVACCLSEALVREAVWSMTNSSLLGSLKLTLISIFCSRNAVHTRRSWIKRPACDLCRRLCPGRGGPSGGPLGRHSPDLGFGHMYIIHIHMTYIYIDMYIYIYTYTDAHTSSLYIYTHTHIRTHSIISHNFVNPYLYLIHISQISEKANMRF